MHCCNIRATNSKVQIPKFAKCNDIVWSLNNEELGMLWAHSTIDHDGKCWWVVVSVGDKFVNNFAYFWFCVQNFALRCGCGGGL